jgi:hypothetical protein
MAEVYRQGDRVKVRETGQTGSVCYVRLAPPDFREMAAVSVLLDDRLEDANRGNYHGTIFPAAAIEPQTFDPNDPAPEDWDGSNPLG